MLEINDKIISKKLSDLEADNENLNDRNVENGEKDTINIIGSNRDSNETKCETCNFVSKSKAGLQLHIKSKHMIKCLKCTFETPEEKNYQKHLSDDHELWNITQPLCDYCCNGADGMHICWNVDDFNEWKGFVMHNLDQNPRSGDFIYECLQCEFTDEERDVMKEHINSNHDNLYSKCGLCDFKNKTWKEMIDHFEAKHSDKIETD